MSIIGRYRTAWSPTPSTQDAPWGDFDEVPPAAATPADWGDDSSSVKALLNRLISRWKTETCFKSAPGDMITVPSFWEILKHEEHAIPALLQDLQQEPSTVFWVLQNIVGENPVPASANGDLNAIVSAWIQWGIKHGHLAQAGPRN